MSNQDDFITGDDFQEPKHEERSQRANQDVREDPPFRRRDEEAKDTGYDPVNAFFDGSSRANFGGISNKLLSTLIEVFNSTSDEYDNPSVDPALARKNFKIYPLDGSVGSSILPTLVLGLPTHVAGKHYVLYFTLILEVPGPQQMRETRTMSLRDEPLQLPVFSEDRMDRKWRDMVKATVSKIGTGIHVDAGKQLIPAGLLDETTDTVAREEIARIYANGIDAICGWRENMLQDAGASVQVARITPAFVGGNRQFEATADFSRAPKFDTSKQPIRSDIAITVYHAERPNLMGRGRSDEEDFIPTRRPIGTISVAVDLHVDAEEQGGWGRSRREPEETGFWQPVLNITDMVGEPNIPWSLESSLLLLGATSILTENFRWVEGLRARTGGKYKSLESLDTLLLAHPDHDKRQLVSDIGPNTSDADLSDYLNLTVKPDVYYGMLLSPGSEKSWCNSIFERIAMASSQDAREEFVSALYEAADTLTGNAFTRIMREIGIPLTTPPVVSVDSRQFTGWFVDTNGNKRDIREWNVPAILNLNKNNPEDALDIALDYQDTIMPHGQSELNYDLATRYRILESALGSSSFHLTGTTEMIQVQTWFIEILVDAMIAAKVMPYNNDHNGLRTRARRTSGYSGSAIRELGAGRRDRGDDQFNRRRGRDYRG